MKVLLLLALAISGGAAQARSFYRTSFKLTVHYTDIENGTQAVVDDRTVEVRYSDDHDFCMVYMGSKTFTCLTYHPDGKPEEAAITINREEGRAFILETFSEDKCPANLSTKFERVSAYLSDTIDLEANGKDFFEQLHDRETEAFHVWLYELKKGTKY